MGGLAKLGWQRLDVLVGEHGAEDVLHMVCDQVANGMSLSEVSKAEGVPYSVLWKWLGAEGRMEAYRVALEARADLEAHELLSIADCATEEGIGVAKLRVDARKWISGKWGRKVYGDGNGIGGGGFGGVTIVIGSVDAGRVLDGECGTEAGLVEVAAEGVRVEGPVQGDLRGSEGREDALHAGRDAA